jgi:hypothetical protein
MNEESRLIYVEEESKVCVGDRSVTHDEVEDRTHRCESDIRVRQS